MMVSLLSLLGTGLLFSAQCGRVPSASNPANIPSRVKAEELCDMVGATNCGDVALLGYMLSFCKRRRFEVELAELVKLEAV